MTKQVNRWILADCGAGHYATDDRKKIHALVRFNCVEADGEPREGICGDYIQFFRPVEGAGRTADELVASL